MITGLVELEYYKLLKKLPLTALYNSNPNLALAKYNFFNPQGPVRHEDREEVVDEDTKETQVVKAVPKGFCGWDFVVVDKGDLTVEEFIKVFPTVHHGVQVTVCAP